MITISREGVELLSIEEDRLRAVAELALTLTVGPWKPTIELLDVVDDEGQVMEGDLWKILRKWQVLVKGLAAADEIKQMLDN